MSVSFTPVRSRTMAWGIYLCGSELVGQWTPGRDVSLPCAARLGLEA